MVQRSDSNPRFKDQRWKDTQSLKHTHTNHNHNTTVYLKINRVTIAHPKCDNHSTNISTYGVWGVKAGIQVSKRIELYLVSNKDQ